MTMQMHGHIESNLEAVHTIISCTSHLKRIVDDILVLSKLDSNLLQISPSCTDPKNILKDLEKMFSVEAQRESIQFSTLADVSLEDTNVRWLLLDHGRINQILINMVTNALKFIKNKKTRVVTVRMGASATRPSEATFGRGTRFAQIQAQQDSVYDSASYTDSGLYLWFIVEDSGIGMTDEEKAKIFSRFAQGSRRTHSEYGGSGLGLFISATLSKTQAGEIGVASEAGVGSRFVFFVKAAHCEAPNALIAKTPAHLSSEPPATVAKPVVLQPRCAVLIVEDNLLNQRVLKKQLMKTYEVHTADNGREALDFLKTTQHWKGQQTDSPRVDVILMDIEMPVLNGLDCTWMIRQHQKDGDLRRHLPIIAVSANARSEQTAEALNAGMDDSIAKPFRVHDLVPKIDLLISRAKAVVVE